MIPLFNIPNWFEGYHIEPSQGESDRLFEFCFGYPFPHHLKAMLGMSLMLM